MDNNVKRYQYIFWDLDGTIINSFEGVTNCMKYAFAKFGIEIKDPAEWRKFIGPPLRESFPKYVGLNKEQTEEAVELYRSRYIPIGVYECELFPDVPETLKAFRDMGCVQVLASSKPEAQCHQVLEKFNLEDALDHIVGASPDGKIDTKLQVLEEAFRRLKLENPDFDRSHVVLIGDTKYDVIGAVEAGIDCIGVDYGFGTKEELLANGALTVCHTLEEVVSYCK